MGLSSFRDPCYRSVPGTLNVVLGERVEEARTPRLLSKGLIGRRAQEDPVGMARADIPDSLVLLRPQGHFGLFLLSRLI